MTYPSDFTDPQTVFGDLADLAIYPVTSIELVSGEWRFYVTFAAGVPDAPVGTPLVYSYPTAVGAYEIVLVVSCNRTDGYIVVAREQEGTSAMLFGTGGHLVQEPTAGTYTALKNLLLLTQKHGGRMGTVLPETCDPGMFFFVTTTGAFHACFSTNTWTRLDLVDHGALTGLNASDAHTIYDTLVQAMAWHAALTKSHLTSALTHDHSDEFSGAAAPMRRFRCGALADRPAVHNIGDIYIALDAKALYTSKNGSTWDLYSIVPRGMIMMFTVSCPSGWERVVAFDSTFFKGATGGVWSGFATGGAINHHHTMPTLITHLHAIAQSALTSSQSDSHTHAIPINGGGGGGYSPFTVGDAAGTTDIASGTDGAHSHTASFPSSVTTSAGVASPVSDDVDGRPGYLTLLFCRKQ